LNVAHCSSNNVAFEGLFKDDLSATEAFTFFFNWEPLLCEETAWDGANFMTQIIFLLQEDKEVDFLNTMGRGPALQIQ
jgi:hypothetical protein